MDGGDRIYLKICIPCMLGAFIPNKKPQRNLMDLKFSDYVVMGEIFRSSGTQLILFSIGT